MKKILLILCTVIPVITMGQSVTNTPSTQGVYWDTTLRASWNFAGVCYRNRLYYRLPLYKNNMNALLQNSHFEAGVELGLAPFTRTSAFIAVQPALPFRLTAKVSHYKDLIGDVFVDGPNGAYNQGYLGFTGLKPDNVEPQRFNSQSLEVEIAPTLTLGGKVGANSALALVYAPIMTYYHSYDSTDANQYRYKASESIIIKKQDILWKHNILLGYSLLDKGLTLGVSGAIQQIQSISGIFRAGVFTFLSYQKAIESKPYLIPYVRTQIGTWLKDRYMQHTFVIQFETGLKYKFY